MASPPPPIESTILFRPSKKRKIYRQRPTEDELPPEPQVASPSASSSPAAQRNAQSIDELIASTALASGLIPESEDLEGTPISIAEILRLRKKSKRAGGVEFRAEHLVHDDDGALVVQHAPADAEARPGEEGDEVGPGTGVIRKFAPQTGTVGDVNKHMMAYIDSELAKRRTEGAQAQSFPIQRPEAPTFVGETKKEIEVERQPASLGRLMEIDLGDEARSVNVQRTDRATRRLNGEIVTEDTIVKAKKVKLGRDGKPWRGKKRRGSDDVKRDQLVEEVLRENRLEIYEEPATESRVINDDQAADDRIAEEFRKEFMDRVSARQRTKPAPAQSSSIRPGGKKDDSPTKGPKLGGSRSARAKMKAMQESAKK